MGQEKEGNYGQKGYPIGDKVLRIEVREKEKKEAVMETPQVERWVRNSPSKGDGPFPDRPRDSKGGVIKGRKKNADMGGSIFETKLEKLCERQGKKWDLGKRGLLGVVREAPFQGCNAKKLSRQTEKKWAKRTGN